MREVKPTLHTGPVSSSDRKSYQYGVPPYWYDLLHSHRNTGSFIQHILLYYSKVVVKLIGRHDQVITPMNNHKMSSHALQSNVLRTCAFLHPDLHRFCVNFAFYIHFNFLLSNGMQSLFCTVNVIEQ